jgi:hypothetical protein
MSFDISYHNSQTNKWKFTNHDQMQTDRIIKQPGELHKKNQEEELTKPNRMTIHKVY